MRSNYPVYVVDDDPQIREWTALLFDEWNLDCRLFASGEEFLAVCDSLGLGCVLLDMRLPRRSGLEVQAELARRKRDLPVIAMTGYGDVDVAVQSMRLGAVEFLEKPFSSEILFDALDRAFGRLAPVE